MDQSSIRRIERLNYVLGGVLIIAAALFTSQRIALGVVVGVVITCANFSAMRRIMPGWMQVASKKPGSRTLLLAPKMVLLMAAVALALLFLPIDAAGLAIGFSIFLISIAIETIRFMTSQGFGDPDPQNGNAQSGNPGSDGSGTGDSET